MPGKQSDVGADGEPVSTLSASDQGTATASVTNTATSTTDEKRRRSRSERKSSTADGDDKKDRERRHRSHKSSKGSRSKSQAPDGSEMSSRRHSKRERDHHHRSSSKREKDKDDGGIRNTASELFSGVSSASFDMSRISLPYPSFSKAHSKEAVHSREDVSSAADQQRRGSNPFTPETTDLNPDDDATASARGPKDRDRDRDGEDNLGDEDKSRLTDFTRRSSTSHKKSSRPPTPPDTDLSADRRRGDDGSSEQQDRRHRKSRTSGGVSRSASLREEHAGSGGSAPGSRLDDRSPSSSQATYVRQPKHRSHDILRSDSRASNSSSRRSSTRRTPSVRDGRRSSRDPDADEESSVTPQDSSPQTPTQSNVPFSPHHVYDLESEPPSKTATPATGMGIPPPPPPPPPPAVDIQDIPRVDYLLQNGGLSYPVPKHFLSVLPRQNGTRPSNPPLTGADTLFAPFFNLLNQYSAVLDKHGSIAVATGHRSIARRLLDRLENVFSRDLPEHGCSCAMCDRKGHEIHRGLTWGDVLEWVSGRIELPQWPPFDLNEIGVRAAEMSAEVPPRPASPVKMDPDIDEQFREHYLRQSKKVRSAVDKWLNKTPDTPVPAPQDVDDETLNFAMLTSLEPEDQSFFNALLSGTREVRPAPRAPTPSRHMRNDFIVKTGLSLQRLYRLQQAPRDAESVVYLVKNPHTHDLLVTLSNINNAEWEILTSGRFDGFLWSGADGPDAGSPGFLGAESRPVSAMSSSTRNTTPFSSPYSRGPTPASHISLTSAGTGYTVGGSGGGSRAPVSNDEETEMAVIAEMERDIYSGMEMLEDAFEKLHHRAEVVRTALRQRGSGLMQNLQNRRRIDVLPQGQTPGLDSRATSAQGYYGRSPSPWTGSMASEADAASDSEWGLDDVELMPDDSASNISSSRHRRPKRRTERRTPAPIEEDEEEY